MIPQHPLRRLAVVQKLYAGGILLLGASPLVLWFLGRLIHKEEWDSAPVLTRFIIDEFFTPVWLVMMGMFLAACAVSAAATAISAGFVPDRKYRHYCKAVAVLNLVYFPFGTALGVVTLRTLARHRAG